MLYANSLLEPAARDSCFGTAIAHAYSVSAVQVSCYARLNRHFYTIIFLPHRLSRMKILEEP